MCCACSVVLVLVLFLGWWVCTLFILYKRFLFWFLLTSSYLSARESTSAFPSPAIALQVNPSRKLVVLIYLTIGKVVLLSFCFVLVCLVWFGLVWFGLVWFGLIWFVWFSVCKCYGFQLLYSLRPMLAQRSCSVWCVVSHFVLVFIWRLPLSLKLCRAFPAFLLAIAYSVSLEALSVVHQSSPMLLWCTFLVHFQKTSSTIWDWLLKAVLHHFWLRCC